MKLQEYVEKAEYRRDFQKMDGSGNWWVVDRDSGQRLAQGFSTRKSAEGWARVRNIPFLPEDESTRAVAGDPILTAYIRSHPDSVFVSRLI